MLTKNQKSTVGIFLGFFVISMGIGNAQAQEFEKYENFRGDTVLVFAESVDMLLERGYLVERASTVKTGFDLNERWTDTDGEYMSSAPGYNPTYPEYHIELPRYVTVGERFEINMPHTWIFYDTEDGTIPIEQAEVDHIIPSNGISPFAGYEIGVTFRMDYPQEMELLSSPEVDKIKVHQLVKWHRNTSELTDTLIYDISGPKNYDMLFMLNDTISYPHNNFRMQIGMEFYDYYLNKVNATTYEISKKLVVPNFGLGGEPQPPCPECTSGKYYVMNHTVSQEPTLPNMTEFAWDLEHGGVDWSVTGHDNIEEMLRDIFPHDWVEEFLENHPKFRANFILPTLNWILPEAMANPVS